MHGGIGGDYAAKTSTLAVIATDIPKEEMLAAMQTVMDLADRTQAAWRNYSGTTCAWMEHFPDIPMPAHATKSRRGNMSDDNDDEGDDPAEYFGDGYHIKTGRRR